MSEREGKRGRECVKEGESVSEREREKKNERLRYHGFLSFNSKKVAVPSKKKHARVAN
jgi:hypothetical protein